MHMQRTENNYATVPAPLAIGIDVEQGSPSHVDDLGVNC